MKPEKQYAQQLETAIGIALKAHAGQRDKAGEPYITHPLRLMMQANGYEEQIVAVLHDVLEESDITANFLHEQGIEKHLIEAIELLTHSNTTEDYLDYVRRIAGNTLARRVKLLDLRDNMNILRLTELKPKDWERLQKYHIAYNLLFSL